MVGKLRVNEKEEDEMENRFKCCGGPIRNLTEDDLTAKSLEFLGWE